MLNIQMDLLYIYLNYNLIHKLTYQPLLLLTIIPNEVDLLFN